MLILNPPHYKKFSSQILFSLEASHSKSSSIQKRLIQNPSHSKSSSFQIKEDEERRTAAAAWGIKAAIGVGGTQLK